MLPCPLQRLQVPAKSGERTCFWCHGQSCCRAQRITSRCPSNAALSQVVSSHGHPVSRAHCSTSRCPPSAADCAGQPVPLATVLPRPLQHLQVPALCGVCAHPPSHGHPCSRNHFSISSCPPRAASLHVLASHGHQFARAHCTTSRLPSSAASANVLSIHWHPFSFAQANSPTDPTN